MALFYDQCQSSVNHSSVLHDNINLTEAVLYTNPIANYIEYYGIALEAVFGMLHRIGRPVLSP